MRVKNPAGLRRKRLNRKFTQRELGFLVKRSHTAIGAIETGKLKTISEDLALLIAARLEVDWEDYFDLEESEVVSSAQSAKHSTLNTKGVAA